MFFIGELFSICELVGINLVIKNRRKINFVSIERKIKNILLLFWFWFIEFIKVKCIYYYLRFFIVIVLNWFSVFIWCFLLYYFVVIFKFFLV